MIATLPRWPYISQGIFQRRNKKKGFPVSLWDNHTPQLSFTMSRLDIVGSQLIMMNVKAPALSSPPASMQLTMPCSKPSAAVNESKRHAYEDVAHTHWNPWFWARSEHLKLRASKARNVSSKAGRPYYWLAHQNINLITKHTPCITMSRIRTFHECMFRDMWATCTVR